MVISTATAIGRSNFTYRLSTYLSIILRKIPTAGDNLINVPWSNLSFHQRVVPSGHGCFKCLLDAQRTVREYGADRLVRFEKSKFELSTLLTCFLRGSSNRTLNSTESTCKESCLSSPLHRCRAWTISDNGECCLYSWASGLQTDMSKVIGLLIFTSLPNGSSRLVI